MVVTGTIKNITEYGAFVDLGGIDGLLHITDMSWGRVNHPSEVFKVGDEVTVKVLKYNPETERVSLGLKQTQEDPWNHAEEAYPLGKHVSGKVMSITDYGAFVELEPGVEGLIHVSEMSWTKKVKHPSKVLEVGQEVECQVLEVDAKAKRISLGLKQLEPDPWTLFTDKYNPGDMIGGKVRSLTDYGVFVGIEEGVDGMVHKSDLSWTQRINNPADLYNKGDDVEAIILSINHDEKKVSLGIKQLCDDPWLRLPEQLPGRHRPRGAREVDRRLRRVRGDRARRRRPRPRLRAPGGLAGRRDASTSRTARSSRPRSSRWIPTSAASRCRSAARSSAKRPPRRSSSWSAPRKRAAARVGPSGGAGATLGDVLKEKLGDKIDDLAKD